MTRARTFGLAIIAWLITTDLAAQEVIQPQPPLVRYWESIPPRPRVAVTEVPEGVTALSWPGQDVVITGGRDRTLTAWSPVRLERRESKPLPPPGQGIELPSLPDLASEAWGELDLETMGRDLWLCSLGGERTVTGPGLPPETLRAATLSGDVMAVGFESGGVVFTSTDLLRNDDTGYRRFEVGAPVGALEFGADGESLFIGDEAGTVHRWSPGEEVEKLADQRGAINALAIDPSGKWLASASSDRTVHIQDLEGENAIVLKGHGSWVSDVTWCPDGKRLLTACYDRVIRLWDTDSGRLLHRFTGHGAAVLKVRFSPDGKRFASIGNDDTLRVWEIPEGPQVDIDRGHEKDVFFVDFSPDGKRLVSGSGDHSLRIWSVDRGVCLRVLHGHTDAVNHVAWSPDGRFIASASTDGTARLWNAKTGKSLAVMRGHRARLTACDFHPDGTRLATGAGDFTIKEWAVPSGALIRTLRGHLGASKNVVYSPDGRFISSGGGDGAVILWDLETGEVAKKLHAQSSYDHCHSVAFTPRATLMAAGYLGYSVRLWDVAQEALVATLEGHTASVEAVSLSPDGQTLASASGDRTVRIWDLRSFQELRRLEGHGMSVYAASWNPDGTMIATCSADRSIKLWQSHTGRLIRTLPATSGAVRALAAGPVAGTDDGMIRIWPFLRGPRAIRAHRGAVTALATLEDQIVSGGADGAVRIWKRKTGAPLDDLDAELAVIKDVAISSDGEWIAAADGHASVPVWCGADRTLHGTIGDPGGSVRALAFVAGEPGLLATGGVDGYLRLWSLDGLHHVRTIDTRGGRTNALAVLGELPLIVTGSDDGLVRVWSARTGELIQSHRGHRGPVIDLAVFGDGRIASLSRDLTARIWPHPATGGKPEVVYTPSTPTALTAGKYRLAIGLARGDVWMPGGGGFATDTLTGLDHGLWARRKTAYLMSALWRGDDGGRVLSRKRPGATTMPLDVSEVHYVPIPSSPSIASPVRVAGTPWDYESELAVTAPESVIVSEAGPGADLAVRVRNAGPEASMLIRLVESSPAPGFLVWPRRSIVRLERGESAEIPITISHLHLGPGKVEVGGPRPLQQKLELAVVDGAGHEVPFAIDVQVRAPEPELAGLEVHRDSNGHPARLAFNLKNGGDLDPGALAVHVEFLRAETRESLGYSEDSDQLYTLAPGSEEGPLTFMLPAALHHVDFPLAFRLYLDAEAWPSLSWISEHAIPQNGR